MINDYDIGGLKMIDVQCCNKSLKMKWVRQSWQMEAFLRLPPPEVRRESSVLSNLDPLDVP